MNKLFLPAILSLFVATGAFAQDPSHPPSSPQQKSEDSQSITLTGCLTKGASQSEYMINDDRTGDRVAFSGSDKLEPFVNQTVQLTGTVSNQGGHRSFQPESVRRVASSCGKR